MTIKIGYARIIDAVLVYFLISTMPFSARAQVPGGQTASLETLGRLSTDGIMSMSDPDLKRLAAILSSEAELFRALDGLYRSSKGDVIQTLLDDRMVSPSLLYALTNKVEPEFEAEVLRNFEFTIQDQVHFLSSVHQRVSGDPDFRRRLKNGIQSVLKKVETLHPKWHWFGERTINVALLSASVAAFAYSFEVSFIHESNRGQFAEMMTAVRNLMCLYAVLPIVTDLMAFQNDLKTYLAERRERQRSLEMLKKLSTYYRNMIEVEDLRPHLLIAAELGSPALKYQIEKWSQSRIENLKADLKRSQAHRGFFQKLRERGLVKDLSRFENFVSDLSLVRNSESSDSYRVMSQFEKMQQENPDLLGPEILEKEFKELYQPIHLAKLDQQAVSRKLTRTNVLLTISLTLIGIHAAVGAESSHLDPVFGEAFVTLIRENTRLIYLGAILPAVVPIAEFWLSMHKFAGRLRLMKDLKVASSRIQELFSTRLQSRIDPFTCSAYLK